MDTGAIAGAGASSFGALCAADPAMEADPITASVDERE